MNKQSISLMSQGEYLKAASFMNEAITKLESALESIALEGDDIDFHKERGPQEVSLLDAAMVPLPSPLQVSAHDAQSPYHLHCAAASFFPNRGSISDKEFFQSVCDQDKVICILNYNLGLCLLLYAISSGKTSQLNDASLAFQVALGVVNETSQKLSDCQLELAVLNNYGHAQFSLRKLTNVATCLERMQFILADLTDDGDLPLAPALKIFYLNLVYNQMLKNRPAPAA